MTRRKTPQTYTRFVVQFVARPYDKMGGATFATRQAAEMYVAGTKASHPAWNVWMTEETYAA